MDFRKLLEEFGVDSTVIEDQPLDLGLPFYVGERLLTYASNDRYFQIANENPAVRYVLTNSKKQDSSKAIICDEPSVIFWKLHEKLAETSFYGSRSESSISKDIQILGDAFLAKKNVVIGKNVTVYPGAVILPNTTIQDDVVIGPNTSIGIEGTQVLRDQDNHRRVVHCGGVTIGQGSYIGANSVIAKSLFRRPTVVGEHVSIGNLVNVGHNCVIGDNVLLLSGAQICGSARIGSGSRVSPGSVISSSVTIGEEVQVKLGSVVVDNLDDNQTVSGNFAISHRLNLMHHAKKKSR